MAWFTHTRMHHSRSECEKSGKIGCCHSKREAMGTKSESLSCLLFQQGEVNSHLKQMGKSFCTPIMFYRYKETLDEKGGLGWAMAY